MTDTALNLTANDLTTADGRPLKQALAQASQRSRWRAFLLVAPLLLYVLVTFAIPIGQMLYLSIYNPVFSDFMPRVTAYLKANPGGGVPGEEGFKALVLDLADAKKNRTVGQVGTRLNYERSGSTSLLKSSGRKATKIKGPPYKDQLLEFRKDWDDPYLWSVMERAAWVSTPPRSILRLIGTAVLSGSSRSDKSMSCCTSAHWFCRR
jgi:putative spermidine/putrescine transport system permease protein